MAITKAPAPKRVPKATEDDVAERFIQGAPDGNQALKAAQDDSKGVQITLRINKDQLERVTAVAKRQGIPRASYIKRAIAIQLEADEKQ